MSVTLRPVDECAFDAVSLGEVMLRLDPGEGRIRTARSFSAYEGGGEYNVTRGLRACFGLRGAVLTGLVDNEVGRLVENFILAGGVDTRFVHWVASDGIGRTVRNGLNFTERGFGVRGAVGVSDRGHTAASQAQASDFDLDRLFGELGVRWLHTGGIFAALSETSAQTVIDVVKAAKAHGTVVSYDLNYRPSLWNAIGGHAKAQEVNKAIAPYIDVMIGNEEDFTACLGLEVEGVDDNLTGDREHHADGALGLPQRVGCTGVVAGDRRGDLVVPGVGDPRPGRRRRLVRVGPHLRSAGRPAVADRGGVRRCPRGVGDDHAR